MKKIMSAASMSRHFWLLFRKSKENRIQEVIERESDRGVNLAGKVKNLFLFTIDVYRLENRKIKVCRVSGGRGPMGGWGPPGASSFINSS